MKYLNPIKPDPERIKAVKNIMVPRNKKELQIFIGFANYYFKFISKFANITLPLYNLLQGTKKFFMGEKDLDAFNKIKEELIKNIELKFYNPRSGKFILRTDASEFCIGCVLEQFKKLRKNSNR